ncbi:MAG: sigma-70 family RNA polymerase sigma factor [Prevotella sp.]|nr:sigma-70 family RNA polymerase sigma factor [Prevotella sp.]
MERNKAINTYINEIGEQELLTDEQERAIAQRIQAGDGDAVSELVEPNLRFVVSMARQYAGQGVPLDDLVSEGNLGMMKAAMRFSPSAGKRFVKFAAPIIRDAMEKAIRQQSGLYKVPQGEATAAEMRRSHPVSVDAPIPAGSQNNFSLLNLLENHDAPYADDAFLKHNTDEILSKALSSLGEREQRVLSLIYGIQGERHTMAETAETMGLRRERVRQIRDAALRKLRKVHLDRLF